MVGLQEMGMRDMANSGRLSTTVNAGQGPQYFSE